MQASKLFVSMAAAATLVGTIGLSYAQTSTGTTDRGATGTITNPDATGTLSNRDSTGTITNTDTANKNTTLDNSTGALGQSDSTAKPMKLARTDRN